MSDIVCEVCFTSSFEPTPDGERCLCCWQAEQIEDRERRILLEREEKEALRQKLAKAQLDEESLRFRYECLLKPQEK